MGRGKGRLWRGLGVLRQGVPSPPWAPHPGLQHPRLLPLAAHRLRVHSVYARRHDMKLGRLSCSSLKLEGFFTDTKLICPIMLSEPHHNLTKGSH